MTKEEIAALKVVLAETHTTERSGKYEAYKVAAYMRDKGCGIIEKIIESNEAILDARKSNSAIKPKKVLIGYVGDLGNGARCFGRAFWTLDQNNSEITAEDIESAEKELSESEGRPVLITSISYL